MIFSFGFHTGFLRRFGFGFGLGFDRVSVWLQFSGLVTGFRFWLQVSGLIKIFRFWLHFSGFGTVSGFGYPTIVTDCIVSRSSGLDISTSEFRGVYYLIKSHHIVLTCHEVLTHTSSLVLS